jgi:hypothetical protein
VPMTTAQPFDIALSHYLAGRGGKR